MKHIGILGYLVLMLWACASKQQVQSVGPTMPIEEKEQQISKEKEEMGNHMTRIQFDSTTHHLGIISNQDERQYTYYFTNTGQHPLIVHNMKTGYGAAAPKWERKPILPGERGEIGLLWRPPNRTGPLRISIDVWTNTVPEQTRLYLEAYIQD